jgi:hypothetical protein
LDLGLVRHLVSVAGLGETYPSSPALSAVSKCFSRDGGHVKLKHTLSRTDMSRKPNVRVTTIVLLVLGASACTDSELYKTSRDPYQANKLTVSGTVCTDDPAQSDFPVKILFILDTSSAMTASKNDPYGYRGKAVEEVVDLWGKSPNYSFGLITFGATSRNLVEDGFTQDSTVLTSAIAAAKGSGGITASAGCVGEKCRDIKSAMSLASSILTGDLLATDPGEVSRTSYIMILLSSGPPIPAIGRCGCRDTTTENLAAYFKSCPWTECDGCKVTCPAAATCKNYTCYPVCDPECSDEQYCDSDYNCKEGDPSGTPTVDATSSEPTVVPDTYTQMIPPATPTFTLPSGAAACTKSCVYPPGNTDSCEERTLVAVVRDMKDYAKKIGAAQFQFHATYLPDGETWASTSKFYPPCSVTADKARAIRLLSEMAYAGNGGFTQFGSASAISFRSVDFYQSREALAIKEFVVSNTNVIANGDGIVADTDGDGIPDEYEDTLGTCSSDEDTDGDGISDGVELKLALDPKTAEAPVECADLTTTTKTGDDPCNEGTQKTWTIYSDDDDGDGLNACEERLLGTKDTLYDSDADGLPDKLEFLAGTNYVDNDTLIDSDFDGMVNREEVRNHTDPRSNDAQSALDLGYRYQETDEGFKEVLSFTQPATVTGVTVKSVSSSSTAGTGYLKFDPGPPPTLAWRDYADMSQGGAYGEAVNVTKAANTVTLESCRNQSSGGTTSCTSDSRARYITVSVEGTDTYPAKAAVDKIIISSTKKNCLKFKVRNITLLETGTSRIYKSKGNNIVSLYFAETPKDSKDSYGIFRVVSLRLNYQKGPPETRTPTGADISFSDEDFVLKK